MYTNIKIMLDDTPYLNKNTTTTTTTTSVETLHSLI